MTRTSDEDISDAEVYRALKERGQRRRASNRMVAPAELTAAGLGFTLHNGGAHLIVAREWDFWPGTGRWCHRGPPQASGRGVFKLIERIKRG
jgi:hypothetical protein